MSSHHAFDCISMSGRRTSVCFFPFTVLLLMLSYCIVFPLCPCTYQPLRWQVCCLSTQRAPWAPCLWSTAASHMWRSSWCWPGPGGRRWPEWSATRKTDRFTFRHTTNCCQTSEGLQDQTDVNSCLSKVLVPYLAFLVAICQDLQAVSSDCQELDVGIRQQGHHLLQSSSQAHGHLCPFLMQQQVVERGDGVEQHTVYWRAGHHTNKTLVDNFQTKALLRASISHTNTCTSPGKGFTSMSIPPSKATRFPKTQDDILTHFVLPTRNPK